MPSDCGYRRNGVWPSARAILARALFIGVLLSAFAAPPRLFAQDPVVLYATQFEESEGFDPDVELIGQAGWVGVGTGGNGLVREEFPGWGQQAYVGFFPPANREDFLSAWRPFRAPVSGTSTSIIHFQVTFQIVASTNGATDDFRWSVYNTNATRLFALDFSTASHEISYVIGDGDYEFTGFTFDHEGIYTLVVKMDFRRNLWTAYLNDIVMANSKPITRSAAALNLGDVDAVWLISNPAKPGNNYMVFDDYFLLIESTPSIPPTLEVLRVTPAGEFDLLIHGQQGLTYDIDVTDNFVDWFLIGTYKAPEGGTFDFRDTTAKDSPYSFYRVFQVP